MNISWQKYCVRLVAISVSIVLVVASITKALSISAFSSVLRQVFLIDENNKDYMAWSVVEVEILLSFAVLYPRFRKNALCLCVLLFSSFASFSLLKMLRFPELPCNCLGSLFSLSPYAMFCIDLLLSLSCAYAYFSLHTSKSGK
jgi:hypothetical protein